MDKIIPECVFYHICEYLLVNDVLACQVAFRLSVVSKRELEYRLGREPIQHIMHTFKNGKTVKYVLKSYFKDTFLYTEVQSWYHKKFPITSIITHKICQTTKEANLWTLHVFTEQPSDKLVRAVQMKHRCIPMLVQLHS